MKKLSLLAILILTLTGIGCGGTDMYADDSKLDVDDPAGLEDGVVRPVGTFVNEAAAAGEFRLVTIKTDKTFHTETMVYCVMAPCNNPGDEGTYRYSKSGSTRYLRFYGPDGEKLSRFAYRLQGDTLYLRNTAEEGADWFEMARSEEAWCAEAADCSIQNLAQPRCPGEWTCSDTSTCYYDCQTINDCEAAGGECVGLNPSACPDGTIGDAEVYSCGDGLGTACCLPKPAAPVCDKLGTSDEGWYHAATGERICYANCSGAEVKCGNVGTRSEGWYTDDGSGCNSSGFIGWDNCGE